ncbi:MAG: GatB/YqeY domain-containing protein [Alphaproteobacteria bacterium]|nr:GatB/YqeY domain-containing protein [Alphaproteobacteria bacterium]MBQ3118008.1 GatB/YqeY domain-containing protein [Alphaproteobacteria bacterium]MBQ6854433.1 GatB/YqeY domain-containing protein [Alphaproteobacteria bacterium]MBQ8557499.1 GatB/YqeY domain-containing protein [Alphaproteobacteria bacterium]
MIRDDLKKALVEALKTKNEKKTATIRLINAAIKDKDIEARPKGITDGIDDSAILSLLQSMVKQRKESIEMYKQGNREDLVAAEQAEIDIINEFLPQQMSEADTKAAIESIIKELNASSIKDMGKVMGALKTKYAGQMDMGSASGIIKGLLA